MSGAAAASGASSWTGPIAYEVALAMLDAGVLVSIAGPDVVRMSPPLVASDDEILHAVATFVDALRRVAQTQGSPA